MAIVLRRFVEVDLDRGETGVLAAGLEELGGEIEPTNAGRPRRAQVTATTPVPQQRRERDGSFMPAKFTSLAAVGVVMAASG